MNDLTDPQYLFEGLTEENLPRAMFDFIQSFLAMENIYLSATREISTKLENLNDEFRYAMDHNPIHQIKTRVKAPKSMLEKMVRRNLPLSLDTARETLDDIAGVRVICSYIDDIYLMERLLLSQDDIRLIRRVDYIANPKPNGYRSLHLIITVPVFLSKRTEQVKVEIQIRTIAMDFWASLEHELAYKMPGERTEEVFRELKSCADVIADTDQRMQKLYSLAAASVKPRTSGPTD